MARRCPRSTAVRSHRSPSAEDPSVSFSSSSYSASFSMAKGLPNSADFLSQASPSSIDLGRPSPVSNRRPSFSIAYKSPSLAALRSHRSPSLGDRSSHPRKLEGETMFLTEDFPCLFRRTMESRHRSKVQDSGPVSEFLAIVPAALATVIELDLQNLH